LVRGKLRKMLTRESRHQIRAGILHRCKRFERHDRIEAARSHEDGPSFVQFEFDQLLHKRMIEFVWRHFPSCDSHAPHNLKGPIRPLKLQRLLNTEEAVIYVDGLTPGPFGLRPIGPCSGNVMLDLRFRFWKSFQAEHNIAQVLPWFGLERICHVCPIDGPFGD